MYLKSGHLHAGTVMILCGTCSRGSNGMDTQLVCEIQSHCCLLLDRFGCGCRFTTSPPCHNRHRPVVVSCPSSWSLEFSCTTLLFPVNYLLHRERKQETCDAFMDITIVPEPKRCSILILMDSCKSSSTTLWCSTQVRLVAPIMSFLDCCIIWQSPYC
jgi:hypothetical protein